MEPQCFVTLVKQCCTEILLLTYLFGGHSNLRLPDITSVVPHIDYAAIMHHGGRLKFPHNPAVHVSCS